MTAGCNIFKCKTDMPSGEMSETDTPVRVRQHTDSPKGAQVTEKTSPYEMSVAHVDRPRRGHNY